MTSLPISVSSFVARRPRGGQTLIAVALLVAAGLLLFSGGQNDRRAAPSPVTENRVVHWQDSQHDWLLVADRATHQLVVYDASTGEPLQRLGNDSGLGEVDSIAQLGDLLLVQDAQGQSTLLGMPGLQPRTLAAR